MYHKVIGIPELINYIMKKLTIFQKIILCISFLLPLMFSALLFFFPEFFNNFPVNEPMTHITYWIFTTIFLLLFFFLLKKNFNKEIKNNNLYSRIKWNITDTTKSLLKYRIKSKQKSFFGFILMIVFFYFIIFSASSILHNPGSVEDDFFLLSYLFIFSILIFSSGIYSFFNVFAGFQDTSFDKIKYSLLFVLPFGILIILIRFSKLLESSEIIQLIQETSKEILFYIIVPFVVLLISLLINYWIKTRDKRGIELYSKELKQNSWHTFFSDKFFDSAFPILFSIFFFVFFLLLFLLESMDNPFFILNQIIFVIILLLILIFFLWGATSALSRSIIKNLFDWSNYFNIYKGQYTTQFNHPNKLIKIQGKCKAVCFSNTYKDNFPTFKQEFILELFKDKKLIEVIRLSESSPFVNTIYTVREENKIKILGVLKRNCVDGVITPIIIAHHIERLET